MPFNVIRRSQFPYESIDAFTSGNESRKTSVAHKNTLKFKVNASTEKKKLDLHQSYNKTRPTLSQTHKIIIVVIIVVLSTRVFFLLTHLTHGSMACSRSIKCLLNEWIIKEIAMTVPIFINTIT